MQGVHKGGKGRGGEVTMLDESQMTVAGAIQCRYPTEFDLEKAL